MRARDELTAERLEKELQEAERKLEEAERLIETVARELGHSTEDESGRREEHDDGEGKR